VSRTRDSAGEAKKKWSMDMETPRGSMSMSRGVVTWRDDGTPIVGRPQGRPVPEYTSTPNDDLGAWGDERGSGGPPQNDGGEGARLGYVDVTDLKIQHLNAMLESERRITRVLSQMSNIRVEEPDAGGNVTNMEVRDMEMERSMPVLENMLVNVGSELTSGNMIKSVPDSEGRRGETTARKIYEAAREMEGWITPIRQPALARVDPGLTSEGEGGGRVQGDAGLSDGASKGTRDKGASLAAEKGKPQGSVPRMKPSSYDGLTPYEDYRVQFNMLSELNGWSDDVKALYLAGSLSKGARSVLNDMVPEERYCYEKLDGALCERYGTDDQAELFKAKLRGRVKSKDESLQELAHDIRRLVRLAYPKVAMSTHDDLTKDQFIESLGDGDIRWSVFQARPKNITEALKVAMELEAFRESEKCRLRRSVRGVSLEESKSHKTLDEGTENGKGEPDLVKFEGSMQWMIAQIDQMRRGTAGWHGAKGANGSMRPAELAGQVQEGQGDNGGDKVGYGTRNGWGNEGPYGARRPLDVSRIKCFRCDKLGHFVRDCPELPKRGAATEVKPDLNE
jgi:hypothetical protein